MRRFAGSALVSLLAVLISTGSAQANSITADMHFVGPSGNNAGGVYTYAYNFSINGGPATSLICDTYENEIIRGETWKATVSGLLSGKGLFGAQALQYKAAAIIFQSILNGSTNPNAGNFAIWALFSSQASQNPFYKSSSAGAIDAWALALAAHTPGSSLKGFVLYTPISGSESWKGHTPQEFIGYNSKAVVPEPGSLILFGTGLVGLALTVRKKFCSTAA